MDTRAPMEGASRPDGAMEQPLAMLAPLAVWGAYFLLLYGGGAIVCARLPEAIAWVQPLSWLLGIAALLTIGGLGWRFGRRLRHVSRHGVEPLLTLRVGLLLSVIAFIATAWTALPTLYYGLCE